MGYVCKRPGARVCAAGWYLAGAACAACPAGSFAAAAGATACTLCPPGATSPPARAACDVRISVAPAASGGGGVSGCPRRCTEVLYDSAAAGNATADSGSTPNTTAGNGTGYGSNSSGGGGGGATCGGSACDGCNATWCAAACLSACAGPALRDDCGTPVCECVRRALGPPVWEPNTTARGGAGRVVRAVAQACCGVAGLPACGSVAAALAALDFYALAPAPAAAGGGASVATVAEHRAWVDVRPGYYAGDVDTVISRSVTVSCPLCLAAAASGSGPLAGAGAGPAAMHVADVVVVTGCRHGGGNGPFYGGAARLATGTDTCDEATLAAEAEACPPGYVPADTAGAAPADGDLNPGPSIARLCVLYASR
jgi:hypothetical protein